MTADQHIARHTDTTVACSSDPGSRCYGIQYNILKLTEADLAAWELGNIQPVQCDHPSAMSREADLDCSAIKRHSGFPGACALIHA